MCKDTDNTDEAYHDGNDKDDESQGDDDGDDYVDNDDGGYNHDADYLVATLCNICKSDTLLLVLRRGT